MAVSSQSSNEWSASSDAAPIFIQPYRKQVFTVWLNCPAGSAGFAGFQRGKFRGVFGMGHSTYCGSQSGTV